MDGMDYYYSREVAATDRDNPPTYHTFDDDAEPSQYRGYGTNSWETDPVDAASLGDYSPYVLLPPDLVREPQYSSHSNSSSHASQRYLSHHSRYPPSHSGQTHGRETVEHEWDHPDFPTWNTTAGGHYTPEYDDAYVLVGADTSPPSARAPPDASIHLQKDGHPTPVRGLFDSGNQFGALISLDMALKLGFRRRDFRGVQQVLQSVAGSEHVTAGSVLARYYLHEDFTNPLEADFHVLERLGGSYDVNIPTEGLAIDPSVTPVAAFLVTAKRAATQEEMRRWEETLRRAEAEQERAETERERRRAADRERRARVRANRRS